VTPFTGFTKFYRLRSRCSVRAKRSTDPVTQLRWLYGSTFVVHTTLLFITFCGCCAFYCVRSGTFVCSHVPTTFCFVVCRVRLHAFSRSAPLPCAFRTATVCRFAGYAHALRAILCVLGCRFAGSYVCLHRPFTRCVLHVCVWDTLHYIAVLGCHRVDAVYTPPTFCYVERCTLFTGSCRCSGSFLHTDTFALPVTGLRCVYHTRYLYPHGLFWTTFELPNSYGTIPLQRLLHILPLRICSPPSPHRIPALPHHRCIWGYFRYRLLLLHRTALLRHHYRLYTRIWLILRFHSVVPHHYDYVVTLCG